MLIGREMRVEDQLKRQRDHARKQAADYLRSARYLMQMAAQSKAQAANFDEALKALRENRPASERRSNLGRGFVEFLPEVIRSLLSRRD